jgi:hypothetical protein
MKLTSIYPVAQPLRLAAMVVLIALTTSCSSRGGSPALPPPVDPEATVRTFLNAVSANSLAGMGQLWGTDNGPASANLDRTTLEQRLTVIRIYLEHEDYTIVPGDPAAGVDVEAGERAVYVRLNRRGCTPTVPFTLVPYAGGWLIRDIDLASAGNPSRRCGAG